ncbi:MAG: UDP-N-acetylmuramate--L-alanine ligase [Deltaproteobacteria bacterium RBG_16_54_11]|jgi:UDP-N-acetylmuramate--alanine ligase|nr:MAG: UDP-N-acetylmuramate--L-alanine ligase [Deltaproteobacteria bacterium RBG_16_54_11]
MYRKKNQQIHFVGIGGIGMSGIAEVLFNLGYRITGSDAKETEITRRLSLMGCTITYAHKPENVQGADVVVFSSAIKRDNPEIREAKARMIPVIPRAEMLAELMRMKYGIAVAGTHGKTTTTSLIATVLAHAGLDPTMVIGGRLNSLGSNARLGEGEFLVAEADESDGSFLTLSPTIAIVTNIDPEHLDYYDDIEHLKRTFLEFINKVPFYGSSILCLDHENIRALIPWVDKRYITYGLDSEANLRGQAIRPDGWGIAFEASWQDRAVGEVRLRMPGVHNVSNALAAIACGLKLDIGFRLIQEALEGFTGVQRRFQLKGADAGVTVIDDYAHHPVEIRVTLAAAKGLGKGRVVALFQPHRYSRTRDLFDEFISAFAEADILFITDIYPAGEDPIPGVTAKALVQEIEKKGGIEVHYVPDRERLVGEIIPLVRPGDIVMTLGAGNIWEVSEGIVEALKKGSA